MKAHICNAAGCFSIVPTANTYCARHQSQQVEKDQRKKASDAARPSRSRGAEYRWIYKDARWRKVRAQQLERSSVCFMCGHPANEVDHIIPHRGREEFAFNLDNLQTLCHACHIRKTNADNRQERA